MIMLIIIIVILNRGMILPLLGMVFMVVFVFTRGSSQRWIPEAQACSDPRTEWQDGTVSGISGFWIRHVSSDNILKYGFWLSIYSFKTTDYPSLFIAAIRARTTGSSGVMQLAPDPAFFAPSSLRCRGLRAVVHVVWITLCYV